MAKKPKYYVVWEGHTPGIYTEWEEAEAQVKGYPEAVFKAFSSREEAEIAYEEGPLDYIGKGNAEGEKGCSAPASAALATENPAPASSAPTSAIGTPTPDRLETLRKQADEIILSIWDQVEAFYKDELPYAKLQKCQAYGMIYYYRTGEAKLTPQTDQKIIEDQKKQTTLEWS